MLASVINRKPDELAGKEWRERDEAGRYWLWPKGSGEIRAYLDASDLAEWIRLKEAGVSKKYSQELAHRAMDAMHELSNGRLRKIKRQRFKDGPSYQETRKYGSCIGGYRLQASGQGRAGTGYRVCGREV